MNREIHQSKAERITRSMRNLADSDYEAVIEASMLAGTHWFNLARHRMKIPGSDRDIMHAEYLDGAQRIEISLLAPAMLSALDEIEAYRAEFVRGDSVGGREIAARCRKLLEVIRIAAFQSRTPRQATKT